MARIIGSAGCLLLAAFCVFGFLATFEPGPHLGWRIGYALTGLLAFCGAIAPWLRPR
jgi:hypothetical protein